MRKLLAMMLLIMSFIDTSLTYAQCDTCNKTNTINFATGVDPTNTVLPIGTYDGNWTIINAPAGANLGPLPVIPLVIDNYYSGGMAIWGRYGPNLTQLKSNGWWISPFPSPGLIFNNPVPATPYTFEYTFCVCEDDSFTLEGLINADDIAQLKLDGTTIIAAANNYNYVFSFNSTAFLTSGTHSLTIELRNTGSTAMGVNCSGTITAQNGNNLAEVDCCHPNGSVNGKKYNDVNNNGLVEIGIDQELQGWQFTLTGPGGTFTSTTNQYGSFNFTNIPPGIYTLSETIQSGWAAVNPVSGFTTVIVHAGDVTTVDFLNKALPSGDPRGCCEEVGEPNLIVNGSFEAGNTGFSSGYTHQPTAATGSTSEGLYSVVTSSEASTISSCWFTLDHTYCSEVPGKFLVVNGRTHTQQSSIIYQQSNIQVEAGEDYTFCMYYRHLPQCEFDIFDINNLNINISGATILEQGCDDEDPCGGWTKISYSIRANSSSLTLSLLLDESGIGDGNDLAFDDFSIRKKREMPSTYCDFDIQSTPDPINPGFSLVNATSNIPLLPPGFDVTWKVMEIDCITGVPVPGTTMTFTSDPYSSNFPGYCCFQGAPFAGIFDNNKCHRIEREVKSCCYNSCLSAWEYKNGVWEYKNGEGQMMMMGNNPTNGETILNESVESRHLPETQPLDRTTEGNINLYPNPGNGIIVIESTVLLKNATLKIYTVDGKLLVEKKLNGRKTNIDISELPDAVYSFEIIKDDGTVVHKKYVKQ